MVAPTGTSGSRVDSELELRGLSRRVAVRVANFLVVPIVVSQTDFISTLPRRLALQLAERYDLRLLPPPLPLSPFGFMAFWHARLEHDPAQRWLREVVVRVSREVVSIDPRTKIVKQAGAKKSTHRVHR